MEGYRSNTYGASFADVYDAWYHDVTDVAACVDALAALARPSNSARAPVLELGVGTGRIALALAARGVEVFGLDASMDMLGQLAAKPDSARVPVVCADMADVPFTGPFSLVFVTFNTFFNMVEPNAQLRCLRRVRSVLDRDGSFVVEAFVPAAPGETPDSGVSVRGIGLDHVVLTAARRDPLEQTISGQHVEITEGGIRLRPWMVRYRSPEQLDELARAAGLTLAQRHADWAGTPFDDTSTAHVSRYVRGR